MALKPIIHKNSHAGDVLTFQVPKRRAGDLMDELYKLRKRERGCVMLADLSSVIEAQIQEFRVYGETSSLAFCRRNYAFISWRCFQRKMHLKTFWAYGHHDSPGMLCTTAVPSYHITLDFLIICI